jgi:ribosomal protein S18 acetylase RimI-like enzyme
LDTTAEKRVRVRRASLRDLDQVAPLFDAYRVFYRQTSDVDAARNFLRDRLTRNESVLLVAEPAQSANPIGFAQLYRSFSSVSLGPIVILNDLYVAPEWRGAGVGRALIEETSRFAAGEGAIRVEIATEHNNAKALGLYRSLGFVVDTDFVHLSRAVAPG